MQAISISPHAPCNPWACFCLSCEHDNVGAQVAEAEGQAAAAAADAKRAVAELAEVRAGADAAAAAHAQAQASAAEKSARLARIEGMHAALLQAHL